MGKQLLITISRTYGSGGHEIGKELADRLGIGFLDRSILDKMGQELGMDPEKFRPFDEKVRNLLLSRTVRGLNERHTNSPEEILAKAQSKYILEQAEAGKSFVLIGRAGSQILKDYPGLVRFFITGDAEHRIRRIMQVRNMSRPEARNAIRRHDRTRKAYHNAYSSRKWGDPNGYEMMFSSSPLGIDGSVDLLESYLRLRGIDLPETPDPV